MALIAHYRLDGKTTNSVGDYSGVANGAIDWVDGKLGKCANFTNGYISNPVISDYLHGRPEASIAMWVKKDSINYGLLQLSGFANSNGTIYPYNTNFNVYLDVFRTNRLGPIIMPSSVLDWHHLIITQAPGVWKLYQNGQLVHQATADQFVSTNYLQFEIGRNSSSRYHDGQISDVRVYDHALSPREVRDLSLGLAVHHAFQHDFYDTVRGERATPVGDVQLADIDGRHCAVINSSGKRLNIKPFSAPVATLTFWHKRDDAQSSSSYRTVLGCVANIHPALFLQGTRVFGIWDGSFKSSGYVPPNDGAFHFYTTVLPGDGTALFYVDGAYLTTVSTTLSLVNNPIDRIGNWNAYYAGIVGEVKLFATALTPAQVKELYQQRASIDSLGNVHTHRLLESGDIKPLGISDRGLAVSSISEIGPARGLVAWYPLDGDVKDYAGNRDGINGGATATADGYQFGLGAQIALPSDVGYTDKVSAFLWFKPTGTSIGGYHAVLGGSGLEISIPDSLAFVRTGVHTSGTQKADNYNSPLELNKWHLVGFSCADNKKTVYKNGVSIGTSSVAGDLDPIFSGRVIGGWGSYSTVGLIKDVRLYNRELSPEEVATLYAITNPDSKQNMMVSVDTTYTKGQFKEVIA